MTEFKVGDKVEVVGSYVNYRVGDVGTITSTGESYHFGTFYRINGDRWGAPANYFKKVEDKYMFKIGDKVKVIKRNGHFGYHGLEIGGTYEISHKHGENGFLLKSIGSGNYPAKNYVHKEEIELYQEDMFEDQWHLNDGKVEIPDDADKLEKDGSVVAFRKRKVKPFEFGEKLRIKKSLWPSDVNDTKNINPGLDYVDAVYISKYFDYNNNEGIKVYINNGEKSWECCFLRLDKVERLT